MKQPSGSQHHATSDDDAVVHATSADDAFQFVANNNTSHPAAADANLLDHVMVKPAEEENITHHSDNNN